MNIYVADENVEEVKCHLSNIMDILIQYGVQNNVFIDCEHATIYDFLLQLESK